MSLTFKRCTICGNEVLVFKDSGNNIICCSKPMITVSPTTPKEDDPHLPNVYQVDDRVLVTVKHPKGKEHHIEWIILETNKGFYKTNIDYDEEPTAIYNLQKDEFIFNVYLYCNVHGLYRD